MLVNICGLGWLPYYHHRNRIDFVYNAGIGFEIFIASGAAALLIALLTFSHQTFRAATTNPTDRLLNEQGCLLQYLEVKAGDQQIFFH
jgi:hypothetical protein